MKGYIYKIASPQTNFVYIGSTTKTLDRRLSGHKSDYNSYLAGKHRYMTSFEVVKFDDCKIEMIRLIYCETKTDLYRWEGQVIQSTDNCVNRNVAGRDKKVYYQENKDKIKESQAQYYQDNQEKIKESQAQYRQDNKDKIKESQAQYRQDNKDKIKEPVTCECGFIVRKDVVSRHKRTNKHI